MIFAPARPPNPAGFPDRRIGQQKGANRRSSNPGSPAKSTGLAPSSVIGGFVACRHESRP
jgi:hypothetical protein